MPHNQLTSTLLALSLTSSLFSMSSEAPLDSEDWLESVAKIDQNLITCIDNPTFTVYSKPFLDLYIVLEKPTGKYYGFLNCVKITSPEANFRRLKMIYNSKK